ncbi:MAG: hypothetical protein CL767_01810 [Chloroflexi bacterium]|nr:hypothetical protein [Chloroflexota bacterium]
MKLILITLVAVVVGMMALACSSEPAATPTPAGPKYSKAEAIAVLKEHLQTKMYQGQGRQYPCLLVIEDNIRNPNSVTWDADYKSYQHLWEVTAIKAPPKDTGLSSTERFLAIKYFSWSIYERTGAIVATGDDPLNQFC